MGLRKRKGGEEEIPRGRGNEKALKTLKLTGMLSSMKLAARKQNIKHNSKAGDMAGAKRMALGVASARGGGVRQDAA